MNQTPQMPKMPSFTPSMDFFSARHNEDSPTFHTNLDVTPTRTMLQSNDQGPSITSTPNTTPNTQNDSCTPAYVRAIFMRLDKIELSLQTIQSILTKTMSSDDPEIEELTRSLQTPAQLEEASDKLKDLAHRKKVVDYLSLLGGKTPGDSVRRMMREIGTNGLWANYSLKGRKGKRNFQDLAIYPIIILEETVSLPHPDPSTTSAAWPVRQQPGSSTHPSSGPSGEVLPAKRPRRQRRTIRKPSPPAMGLWVGNIGVGLQLGPRLQPCPRL
ncbi:uncharacterized protein [Pseudorasbora parva]|uniref:uncharacterized protein n=1 Tax=Pseudorasbora parva TaxID=51549 RepID=UPI00351EC590